MGKTAPAIRSVKARAVVTPIARPVKNAFGVITEAPLVLNKGTVEFCVSPGLLTTQKNVFASSM